MMIKPVKLIVIAASSVALLAGGGAAYAAIAPGPTPTQNPGTGPFYPQGYLNLCVNQSTEQVRVELHTATQGNCAGNEVQMTVETVPSEAGGS
jgi:hypothetical protein